MIRRSDRSGYRELSRRLGACKRAGLVLTGLNFIQSGLQIAMALITREAIDSMVSGGENALLWTGALLAVALCIPLLRAGISGYGGWQTDRAVARLRRDSLVLLQTKDCEQVNGYHSGYLFNRIMEDCWTICEQYTNLFPVLAGQIVQLLGSFGALVLLAPELAVVIFGCGSVVALGGFFLRKILKKRHMTVRRAGEKMVACLQETLEHQELCRTVMAEGEAGRRFQKRLDSWLKARTSLRRLSVSGSAAFSGVIQLGTAGVILWGGFSIGAGTITFGDLTALLQLLNLFRSPVSGLTGTQGRLAAADAATDRLLELWQMNDESVGETPPEGARCTGLIFEDVTFSYEGEEQPVLKNFSARVELDRWVCLTGESGRGKSSLYRLILGLYRPQKGKIWVETDRGIYPCSRATRHLFGFVPQSPILFSGTLRENLLLVKPEATEEELWRVLEFAECAFVQELPQGLDTSLGELGNGLSVGQRQRIVIARTLLNGDCVMLLDEITSALDRETEKRLLSKLAVNCPGALIATHRPEALDGLSTAVLSLGER